MEKYLYLTRHEWTEAWTNGGEIPLALASSYRSVERNGTLTPDENLIHECHIDITSLRQHGIYIENVKDFTLENNISNGRPLPSFKNANYYVDDGLILSFSNVLSSEICQKLGKEACVEIVDIENLKRVIDSQLGVKGIAKDCEYTSDHQRNHFLKSLNDQWQEEYRFFWPILEQKIVTLPPGMARTVDLKLELITKRSSKWSFEID